MNFRHILILLTMAGTAGGAFAQWQWTDPDGRKVFSDRPPPAEIPERNILRRPQTTAPLAAADAGNQASAPDGAPARPAATAKLPPSGSAAPPKGQDAALEARKKAADDQEATKKAADEQRQVQARRENCQRARQAQTTLDSGIRIAQVNNQGERIIMDDAARAAEARRNLSVMQSDCR